MSNLPTHGWETEDERGNRALHRDHTAANNYVTRPTPTHGVVRRLVSDDDVDALVASLFSEFYDAPVCNDSASQAKEGET